MNNKELPRGRQTLGMATALPPVREKGLAPPPTREEVKAANAGELAPRGIVKTVLDTAKRHPVITSGAGAAAVVTGFAAVEAYQGNIPGIHREAQPFGFDNSAEKIAINQNNVQFVTLEQIQQQDLEPVINKETQTIEFLLPFKMPENTTGTIERIDLKRLNPNAPENLPPIVPIDFKFNNIVKIIAPEKSHMYLIRGNPEFDQDPNFPAQVRFYKYYPEQDTTVVWWFFDNNPTKQGHFITSLPMQDFDKFVLRGTNYEKLPIVDALTEVMTTSEINQPVHLDVMAYRGKVVGPEAEIAGDDFLLEPKFQTTATGGQMAVIAFTK